MHALAVAAVLGFASLGSAHNNAHRDIHRHMQVHQRDFEATVTEVTTDYYTVTVYEDETSSSTSSSVEAAVFIQKPTTTSTSTTPTTTSTSTSTTPVTPPPVKAEVQTPTTTTTPTPAPKPTTSAAPALPNAETVNGYRIFTVTNMHTAPVSTFHDDTVGTPTSAGAPLQAGTLGVGAVATFAVPSGWVGNVQYGDASFPLGGDTSLLEANWNNWGGQMRADVDVSFVNGFTLPATCSCAGTTTTGCNLDLSALSSCPGGLTNGACQNPLRSLEAATSAAAFFAECEGAAWTFVNDGGADSNCVEGNIVCCIGTACPPNPKQGSAKLKPRVKGRRL